MAVPTRLGKEAEGGTATEPRLTDSKNLKISRAKLLTLYIFFAHTNPQGGDPKNDPKSVANSEAGGVANRDTGCVANRDTTCVANSKAQNDPNDQPNMPKIDEHIAQRIKDSANIMDVMSDLGVQLHKSGTEYVGLCPFHNGTKFGNFKVNPRKNIATCFGDCCKTWGPIDAVMEGMGLTYPEALRHLAATYNIYIDDEPAPKVKRVCKPRPQMPPEPPKTWTVWSLDIVKKYINQPNVLTTWMLSLPMREEHKRNLRNMIKLYLVGTSLQGYTEGWVIWPYVDMNMKLRNMKFMHYLPDGHRDKKWTPNWMSAMLAKNGLWDSETKKVILCPFGSHLAHIFPNAEVCMVESEKTAVICSAFSNPEEKIWVACGGLNFFKPDMLNELIAANRYIVVYPDADGAEKWAKVIENIGYSRMSMTTKMQDVEHGGLYNPILDGPKADIADIMIRMMNGVEETLAEKICRRLHAPDKVEVLGRMIERFDMIEEK